VAEVKEISEHRAYNTEITALEEVNSTISTVGGKVDPPPSGAPWAMSLTAKWSTTLA